jgi:hypothetical protein
VSVLLLWARDRERAFITTSVKAHSTHIDCENKLKLCERLPDVFGLPPEDARSPGTWKIPGVLGPASLGSRVSSRSTVLMGTDIFNSYLFFTYVGHPRPSVKKKDS